MPNPKLSIIVLNWNGKQFLNDCFTSIARQTLPRKNFETLLVDNGSTDGSVEYVKKVFPWVKILPLPENVGFAKGNNYGIFHAKGEWIFTLNNDTKLDPECLAKIVQRIATENDPRIGMYSIKMRFFYEPDELNSTGTLIYKDGSAMNRGMREKDKGQYDDPAHADIFGPCAGAGIYCRQMLDEIAHPPSLATVSAHHSRNEVGRPTHHPLPPPRGGYVSQAPDAESQFLNLSPKNLRSNDSFEEFMRGVPEYFDAAFFIYLEDVDLIWRAQLLGWKARYISSAVLYHIHSATMEAKSPKKLYLAERNRIWYTFKVFPLSMFLTSPWHTFRRYLAIRKTVGGGSAKYSSFQLFCALCKAWFHGKLGLWRFWRKRKQIQKSKKLSSAEIRQLFIRYGATKEQIAQA